jgi:hypothetical protein
VTGPLFLARFSLDKVDDVVREQLTDDSEIKAELMALQLALELGDIDDAEYVRREAGLMARLREVRAWREELGMGVAGGPVRVAPAAEAPPAPPDATPPAAEPAAPSPVADPGAGVEIELDWE